MLLRTHTKSFPLFRTPDEGKSRQNRQVNGRMESSSVATSLGPQSITDSATWNSQSPHRSLFIQEPSSLSRKHNLFRHNINIYTLKASKGNNLATMCCRNFSAQLSVTSQNLLCPKAKRTGERNEFSIKFCGKCAHFFRRWRKNVTITRHSRFILFTSP